MIFNVESLTEEAYETAIADFIGTHENATRSYGAHYDGGDSIALGYGLDLLANDNASIIKYRPLH